jgi:hypothetical protein
VSRCDRDVCIHALTGLPRREPHADRVLRLRREAGVQECALERRDLCEHRGVDHEVGVRRVGRDRKVRVADAEVDRLRADEDECVTVIDRRAQHVEQHSPGHHMQLVELAHRRHRSSFELIQAISSSPSCGPRPGLVSRSGATTLGAA